MQNSAMQKSDFTLSNKLFIDPKNFPRGFRKCGDFSISEADILTQYGYSLQTLTNGDTPPITDEEKRLIDVIKGIEPAVSKIEKTWMKYLRLTMSPRRFYTLHSSSKIQDDLEEYDFADFEAEEA